jgi:hypothetical protein
LVQPGKKATPYNAKQAAVEHNEPARESESLAYLGFKIVIGWATQVETQQRLRFTTNGCHIHVDFHVSRN